MVHARHRNLRDGRFAQLLRQCRHGRILIQVEIGASPSRVLRGVLNGAQSVAGIVEREHQRPCVRPRVRIGGNQTEASAHPVVMVSELFLPLG